MFKNGLYQFLPSIKSGRLTVAVLWIAVVLLILIGILLTQGASPSIPQMMG